jgi:hypothetical protein
MRTNPKGTELRGQSESLLSTARPLRNAALTRNTFGKYFQIGKYRFTLVSRRLRHVVGVGRGGDFCGRTLEVPLLHATNVTSRLMCQRQVMLCYCIQQCGDNPCFPVRETCDWPCEADGVGV